MENDKKNSAEELDLIEYLNEYSPIPERNYSYFCKYNELVGVVACPGVPQVALKDSCYSDWKTIFGRE